MASKGQKGTPTQDVSPPLRFPDPFQTPWFFWLPVTCSPEPPLYTPVTSKFLAKAWVSPKRLQSSFSQVGFPPSTLPHPAGAPRILEPALLYLLLTPPTPSLLCHCSTPRCSTFLPCLPHWGLTPPPYPARQQHTVAISPVSRLVQGSWGMLPKDLCWGSCPPPICKVGSPSHRPSIFWTWTDSLCVV